MWAKASISPLSTAPQPLDEDVVHAPALAVHADGDPVPLEGAGKVVAGELAALVGIEDLRPAVARESFLERFDAPKCPRHSRQHENGRESPRRRLKLSTDLGD